MILRPNPGTSRETASRLTPEQGAEEPSHRRLCTLSQAEFEQIRSLVTRLSGIRLPDVKRVLVEARARRRLTALGLPSFEAYLSYLQEPDNARREQAALVDVMTTNKTEFFREAAHFELLVRRVAEPFLSEKPGACLQVWSAGCSSGQEPYSIAMTLLDFRRQHPGFDFRIIATDLSHSVLATAKQAIYPEDAIAGIPIALRERYLLRSREPRRQQYRIAPQVREKIAFGQANLISELPSWLGGFHVVFCRNVLIYFERAEQEKVLTRLGRALLPGGWLLLGHSESLVGFSLPYRHEAPSAFRRV